MVIYADVFILENVIVNLFLITVTMNMVKHKCKLALLITASLLGGIYSLVIILPELKVFSSLPFELIIAVLMLRIAHGKIGIFNMIKVASIFLTMTFTLSGLCFLFSVKQNVYILGNNFEISKYSIKYLILGMMIIYIVFNRIINYIKDKTFVNNYMCNINFTIEDKNYDLKSFLDTGNELREPITNLPCILVEENFLKEINFRNNTYYIPYSAIGYEGGLNGIRVNKIKIEGENFLYKEIDAIICPCKEKLSGENEFNALLSRGIM